MIGAETNRGTGADLVEVRPSMGALRLLRDRPHEFLLGLRQRHGTAIRLRLGPISVFLLSDPVHVQAVLVAGHREFTKNTFQYRLLSSVTGDGLLTMDGPEWLARRRLEQPLFHREAVQEWAAQIGEATERLLREWQGAADDGRPRDIADDMLRVALDVVTATLFPAGGRFDRRRVLDATMQVLSHIMNRARTLGAVPLWLPTPANRRFRRALRDLDSVLYDMIRIRRRSGAGHDLLSHLAFDADGGRSALSDRQIRDELLTMIIAGHETVASALAWAWDLLARHPEIDRALARESSRIEDDTETSGSPVTDSPYSARVFDETLRLYPPAWLITRKAVRRANVGGIEIPAGALVAISPYVLHRDVRLWHNPDRFDPERFSADGPGVEARNAFIPFGAGPHLCIGAHMARLEARILLTRASRRFRLTAMSDRPSRVEPGVTLHPKGGLWMRVERRTATGQRA